MSDGSVLAIALLVSCRMMPPNGRMVHTHYRYHSPPPP